MTLWAYAVDGYPADCVVVALAGIMRDNPPDLVISGINGGANLGKDWLGSGTIGAARIASFAGVPAIAVSGLASEIPDAIEAATDWVVQFTQCPIVRNLHPPQYLTVSLQRISPDEIKGVKIAKRSSLVEIPILKKVADDEESGNQEIWRIVGTEKRKTPPPANSDIPLYNEGYIVIVPMLADEVDYSSLDSLQQRTDKLPNWKK